MKTAKLFGAGALLLALVALGCDKAKTTTVTKGPDPAGKKDDPDHDEHGEGPHGGAIFDLGKYHAEFTVDHNKKQATVYIYTTDLKKAVPIKTEKLLLTINNPMFQVDLKAEPLEGEAKGTSSRFVGTHEKLGVVQEFEGNVSGDIDGKPRDGDFKEKADPKDKDKK